MPQVGVQANYKDSPLGYNGHIALVAQWIEYLTSNQLVERSNRSGGAIFICLRIP